VLLAVAGLWACAGSGPPAEIGAECVDGKDNDRDGLIDCRDGDCAGLAICGQLDGGTADLWPPDLGPQPDLRRDQQPDLPPLDLGQDQGSATGYGTPCEWRGTFKACDDGTSFCVLDDDWDGAYCTRDCKPSSDDCTAPDGMRAACIYTFDGQPVCMFVCHYLGNEYDCPPGLECVAQIQYPQRECHP